MGLALFKKIISKLKDEEYTGVYLCGLGEPLLHDSLIQIIKQVKKSNLRLGFSTNGFLMNSKVSGELVENRVDRVDINFPSLDKKVYELMCRGSVFETVKRNIDYLLGLKSKIQVRINVVATNVNFKEINKIVDYWFTRRRVQVNLVPFNNRGQVNPGFDRLRLNSNANRDIFKQFTAVNPVLCCSLFFSNYTFIGWDGYEYGCPADLNKTTKIRYFLDGPEKGKLVKDRKSGFWETGLCKNCQSLVPRNYNGRIQ